MLIFWLGRSLGRAGSTFLPDALAANASLVDAVAHLLDVGFYLASMGYVAITDHTVWQLLDSDWAAAESAIAKLGGLTLILGFGPLFNLLLLALFRRHGSQTDQVIGAQ
jgi:hypothetical protein